MKILLTGASGLLGRAVYRELKELRSGFDVTGTAFSRTGDGLIRLDLRDDDAVAGIIAKGNWDLVIHSAAERRPDVVMNDPSSAEKLNVSAVGRIASAVEKTGAAMLYISTDYVFDGTSPPYSPDSAANPLNDYGRMKLAGEQECFSNSSRPIVLRLPLLYGGEQDPAESAVSVIAAGIRADTESFHDNEAIRHPTHVADVAFVMAEIIELLNDERAGGRRITGQTYHWSGEYSLTKYDIALLMAELMGVDCSLIKPAAADRGAASRPKNATLDTSSLRTLGIGRETCFRSALREDFRRLGLI